MTPQSPRNGLKIWAFEKSYRQMYLIWREKGGKILGKSSRINIIKWWVFPYQLRATVSSKVGVYIFVAYDEIKAWFHQTWYRLAIWGIIASYCVNSRMNRKYSPKRLIRPHTKRTRVSQIAKKAQLRVEYYDKWGFDYIKNQRAIKYEWTIN